MLIPEDNTYNEIREKSVRQWLDEMSQHGNLYAFAQQEAKYENVTVIYSLTFDENMKLVGLYIR